MRTTIVALLVVSYQAIAQDNTSLNIIHGPSHLFTVETPDGWLNDLATAQSIGLTCIFFRQEDNHQKNKSYMFAMGYDKDGFHKDLDAFITADIKEFKVKYPKAKTISTHLSIDSTVVAARRVTYSNLPDRFIEQVTYIETQTTIVVMPFAAFTEDKYDQDKLSYEQFVSSFVFRTSDPQPYLEALEEFQKNK